MNSSDSQPKLPTWIFILFNVVAVGAAFLIGATSTRPLSSDAMLGIVGCLLFGAMAGLVPIVLRFERLKNETLDDRQRALESLARTVHASAEQLSIATNGLHEIAELAQKNLRHAEHLPQKLQEKIAEFQAGLSAATDTEKEELERELLALRTSESERLDTVSQRITKSTAEWTKLEAATQQHLDAASEALNKLALGTAGAIGKAQAAAEQALTQARTEAARTIGESSGQATRSIESAKAAALAEIDTKFAAAATAIIERITREIGAKSSRATTPPPEEKPARAEPAAPAPATPEPAPAAAPEPAASEPTPAAAPENPPAAVAVEPIAAPAPKRPRKPRREEPAPAATATAEASAAPTTAEPAPAPAKVEVAVAVVAEPPPVPASQIPEVAPIAPHTAEPFSGHLVQEKPAATAEPPAKVAEPPAPAAAPAPRKRAKKPEPAPVAAAAKDEPSLALDLDGAGESNGPAVIERVLSSDGATRLVVTAYIGIGNRLFIRGTGPGLSWEKGVPLQFVSIGKWRWETNDATNAVQFKLYKNDEVECTALGAQSLDPGHQQELTAAF